MKKRIIAQFVFNALKRMMKVRILFNVINARIGFIVIVIIFQMNNCKTILNTNIHALCAELRKKLKINFIKNNMYLSEQINNIFNPQNIFHIFKDINLKNNRNK
jgi:hypothetical protein